MRKAITEIGTAVEAKVKRGRIPPDLANRIDAMIQLQRAQDVNIKVFVEIKRTLRPAHLPELEYLRDQCKRSDPEADFLVVTESITEPLAQELKARHMWFVDSAGNLHIDLTGQLLLFVTGRKLAHEPKRSVGWRSSEQSAKLLFQLVRSGPDVEATYRDLVDASGISLGVVSKLFSIWREQDLLRRAGRGAYRIIEPDKVLEHWCDDYAGQLAPNVQFGRFTSPSGENLGALFESADLLKGVVVGGEYAADLLTGYLRGSRVHLYVPKKAADEVRNRLRLVPSREGNIELRDCFATNLRYKSSRRETKIAHPALIYAELMAGEHRRLAETAMRLREEYLAWTLSSN